MRTTRALVIVAILALFGCATAGADDGDPVADSATLNGAVVLRQPAPLPDGTLLTVTLEDVSLADAPAVTLAQTQFEVKNQQSPIPFAVVYPTSAVQPGRSTPPAPGSPSAISCCSSRPSGMRWIRSTRCRSS